MVCSIVKKCSFQIHICQWPLCLLNSTYFNSDFMFFEKKSLEEATFFDKTEYTTWFPIAIRDLKTCILLVLEILRVKTTLGTLLESAASHIKSVPVLVHPQRLSSHCVFAKHWAAITKVRNWQWNNFAGQCRAFLANRSNFFIFKEEAPECWVVLRPDSIAVNFCKM